MSKTIGQRLVWECHASCDGVPYSRHWSALAARIDAALAEQSQALVRTWPEPGTIIDDLRAERDLLRSERDEQARLVGSGTETILALRAEVKSLTHKIITCGVAAQHPDAALSSRPRDYGGPWDSPQAQAVRALRAERDELLK